MNFSYKRVGAMRFLKIGRLSITWSIAKRGTPFRKIGEK